MDNFKESVQHREEARKLFESSLRTLNTLLHRLVRQGEKFDLPKRPKRDNYRIKHFYEKAKREYDNSEEVKKAREIEEMYPGVLEDGILLGIGGSDYFPSRLAAFDVLTKEVNTPTGPYNVTIYGFYKSPRDHVAASGTSTLLVDVDTYDSCFYLFPNPSYDGIKDVPSLLGKVVKKNETALKAGKPIVEIPAGRSSFVDDKSRLEPFTRILYALDIADQMISRVQHPKHS